MRGGSLVRYALHRRASLTSAPRYRFEHRQSRSIFSWGRPGEIRAFVGDWRDCFRDRHDVRPWPGGGAAGLVRRACAGRDPRVGRGTVRGFRQAGPWRSGRRRGRVSHPPGLGAGRGAGCVRGLDHLAGRWLAPVRYLRRLARVVLRARRGHDVPRCHHRAADDDDTGRRPGPRTRPARGAVRGRGVPVELDPARVGDQRLRCRTPQRRRRGDPGAVVRRRVRDVRAVPGGAARRAASPAASGRAQARGDPRPGGPPGAAAGEHRRRAGSW